MELIAIFHLLLALILIVLVLLQDSKGGAMGMFGGGGGGSIFGSSGGGDFLAKATKVVAIFFSFTCIALAYITSSSDKSVLDGYVAPAKQEMPQTEEKSADQKSAKDEAPSTPVESNSEKKDENKVSK